MLRLKPQPSISAPTASATLSTAGSTRSLLTSTSSSSGGCDGGLLARRDARDVAAFARQLRDDRRLLAAAIDDLDDLALRQAARRADRDARLLAAAQLARGDAEDRLDVDGHHELDAHRARRGRAADRRARPGRACGSSQRRSTRPGRARSRRTSGSRDVVANSLRARTGSIELRGIITANRVSPTLMPMSCGVTSSSAASSASPDEDAGVRGGAERDDLVGVRALATACVAKIRSTMRCTAGHRVMPPTSRTSSTSPALEAGVGERAPARCLERDRAGPCVSCSISSRVIVRS